MGLPDERARGSVANLIGRFEKQTRPSDASAPASTPPKVIVPGRVLPTNKPTETSGPSASWVKKKDTLPPQSPKDKASLQGTANGADAPKPIVPPPEPAPAETTIVAEPEAVAAVDLGDGKDDDPQEAQVAPVEEPATHASTAEPKEEPLDAPAPSTSSPRKPDPSPKVARPGTGGSKAPTATSARPSQSAATTSKTGGSPSKPARAATSSLNKAKSTPALKKGAEPASTTPSRPSTAKTKDANPPAQPLKPQYTGASTASNPRRTVASTGAASASGTKTPATTGGPPLVKPQPTRPIKTSQSSTLYAPTAATLARQRKEEAGPPPSAGKKAAILTASPTTRPRAGSTSGAPSGLRPLQLPLKSSVSASGSTRRMVSVSRSSKADVPEGEGPAAAAAASTTTVPAPRDRSPAKRTPVKPFPSRSPTKSPLSKAQMGGTARIVKNVGAWAGAVAAAGPIAVTSEELVLGGELPVPEGSGIEDGKAVAPEAQQLDATAAEPAAAAASSGLGDGMPEENGPADTVDQTPPEPTAQPEPEEEQEEIKAGHHTDIEDTAAAPSTADEPTTPEPQAVVPIVDANSVNPEESEQLQQPEQDEIEQMVNMLEAPGKALHFGASSDEDEDDPAPVQLRTAESSIPDIPSDG